MNSDDLKGEGLLIGKAPNEMNKPVFIDFYKNCLNANSVIIGTPVCGLSFDIKKLNTK